MKSLLFSTLLLAASTILAQYVVNDKKNSLVCQDSKDNRDISMTYY